MANDQKLKHSIMIQFGTASWDFGTFGDGRNNHHRKCCASAAPRRKGSTKGKSSTNRQRKMLPGARLYRSSSWVRVFEAPVGVWFLFPGCG
jgi:hypothetical protein